MNKIPPSSDKPVITTARDFAIFKAECRRMVPKLGLAGWTLYFTHLSMKDKYAEAQVNALQKIANLAFNLDWITHYGDHPASPENIRRVARHEMAHVFLGDLYGLATSRFVQREEVEEAEHRAVRVLEKLL